MRQRSLIRNVLSCVPQPFFSRIPSLRQQCLVFMLICLFNFTISPYAMQPVISTIVSTNEAITIFTVSGRDLPELKRISFTCTSQLPLAVIMDAIIATPVPAAVINVQVDRESGSLHIILVATTTVTIPSNATLFTLKMPVSTAADGSSFFVTASAVTDKNGNIIQASLNPASVVRRLSRVSSQGFKKRNDGLSSIYLLNGQCRRSSNRPFAEAEGLVLIHQSNSSVRHLVLLR